MWKHIRRIDEDQFEEAHPPHREDGCKARKIFPLSHVDIRGIHELDKGVQCYQKTWRHAAVVLD